MDQDFFTNLPSEILLNILSRLPVRTIITCKCVRKSWLHLLTSDDFVNCHLSRSPSALLFLQSEVYEFDDALDLDRHDLHYNPPLKFDYTSFVTRPDVVILGTIDGLLLLHDYISEHESLYVCNPITRDYIELPCPPPPPDRYNTVVAHGFGADRSSFRHKVVRIFHDCYPKFTPIPESVCHVYTLGTGSWRRIDSSSGAGAAPLNYYGWGNGEFLHGRLHWLVSDSDTSPCISCFDIETELFSVLCAAPERKHFKRLGLLRDCLCLCDAMSGAGIVIWLMKEYGVEESWTKEFVIEMPEFAGWFYDVVIPIKIFEDGDVLIAWYDRFLFYYSGKRRSCRKIDMFEMYSPADHIHGMHYSLSFLSLKSFGNENVRSF